MKFKLFPSMHNPSACRLILVIAGVIALHGTILTYAFQPTHASLKKYAFDTQSPNVSKSPSGNLITVSMISQAKPDIKNQSELNLNPESLKSESLNPEFRNPESLKPESLTPESLNSESLNSESLKPASDPVTQSSPVEKTPLSLSKTQNVRSKNQNVLSNTQNSLSDKKFAPKQNSGAVSSSRNVAVLNSDTTQTLQTREGNVNQAEEPSAFPAKDPVYLVHPSFKEQRPIPDYPQRALSMRQQGNVVIRVLISKQGQVIDAQVHQSSGSEWLDAAAVRAALRAKFHPYVRNGVALNAHADMPFNFVIKR